MAENVLESYFVKVGALPDLASFDRLKRVLFDTEKHVDNFAWRAVKNFAFVEVAITGAFAAAGVAMIAAADKAAMTDQSYRLLGLRMLMNKQSARAMQQALDQLGATIDQVAYDPELNKRFQYLYEQNIKLGKQLGKSFDDDMLRIRDLRMEYKRFSNEFTYIIWGSIAQTFEKLGYNQDNVLTKLHSMNDWVVENLPHIADEVSNVLVPVWKDMEVVLKDTVAILKEAGTDFIHLTGELSGDDSLSKASLTMESLAQATLKWVDALARAALTLNLIGRMTGHFTKAAWETLVSDVYSGPLMSPEASKKHHAAAEDEASQFMADIHGLVNPDFARSMGGKGFRDFDSIVNLENRIKSSQGKFTNNTIDRIAGETGVDPDLIRSMIQQESGGNPNAVSPKGAGGLMQLKPGTAKEMGVTDLFDPVQSIRGGAKYFAKMYQKFSHDIYKALAAYNAGPGAVERFGGVPPFKETQNYVERVTRRYESLKSGGTQSGSVVINGGVNISVPHNVPEKDWKRWGTDFLNDVIEKRERKTTAQTAGGSFH